MEFDEKKFIDVLNAIRYVQQERPEEAERLENAGDEAAVYGILSPYLQGMTQEEFHVTLISSMEDKVPMGENGELSDEALEIVTGGSWKSFWKGFGKGFVGTFKVIGSAAMIAFNVWNQDPTMAEKWGGALEKSVKDLSSALKE
ncbi:MAG: hypothetical protein ACI3ZR_09680 [bacterium]